MTNDIDAIRDCTHASGCPVHPEAWGLHNYDDLSAKVNELTTERNDLLRELAKVTAALTESRENAATLANEVGQLTAENARVRQERDDALAANEPQYLVWSHKQRAWWGPGAHGYRQDITSAGRFPLKKATDHANTRSWPADLKTPPEVAIPAPPGEILADPNRISEYVEVHIKAATDAKIADRHAARDAEAEATR